MKCTFLCKKLLVAGFLLSISNHVFSQLSPMVIGTINPGDSVVIYYDATINTGAGASVTNQGTITGSNFSSLVTDDPKTAAANDPTVTLLNMFPLPVTLIEFKAYQKNNMVEITWKTSELNVNRHEIEKSLDGSQFAKILTVLSAGNGTHNYISSDVNPHNGNNFYRLKTIDIDGKFKYSPVVRVNLGNREQMLIVFPNPVSGKTITLQYNNIPHGEYQLQLVNIVGQVVYTQSIRALSGTGAEVIHLLGNIVSGIYSLKISNANLTFNNKIIIH